MDSNDMDKQCRSCKHWQPLFTGEAWDVRSFVDAPESERTRIEKLLEIKYGDPAWRDAKEALMPIEHACLQYDHKDIPGDNTEWPYWGECALTVYDDPASETTLARAAYGSYYYAVLRCRCNFGCVQWEEVQLPTSDCP